jgi:lipopolysaccharide/colanic/teichoic acid biosynthesis glycosyltransferase
MSARPGIAPGPARRALDVGVALAVLVLGAPLLAAVALWIVVSDGAPVLYRQDRVGQGGLPFTLYKFRTMRAGRAGPEVTAPGDPRVTGVGRFLRRTSLDELPQFFNVLAGRMTLVGPRPETPALAARYTGDCAAVFLYRPGLTGQSQLRFRDTEMLAPSIADPEVFYLTELVPRRVALDRAFLEDPSFGRTLSVLARTALSVAASLRSAPGRDGAAASLSDRIER